MADSEHPERAAQAGISLLPPEDGGLAMPIAAVHIAQSLQRGLDSLIAFIPNLVGCLIILLIGYVIARLVKEAVIKVLETVGLDRALSGSPAGAYVERASPGARPSRLVGLVVFWFIFIYAIAAA